ncbi:MAG: GGDEF domain-containing protein [Bacillota bacterium]
MNQDLLKKLYQVICILIPINIAIFSQLKERGIFSLWGKIRIAFFLVEMYTIYKMILSENPDIENILYYNTPLISVDKLSIPQMSFITFFIAISFFTITAVIKRSSWEIHMIGILVSVFLSLSLIEDRIRFSIFFAAAGLILIISIIEDSYAMAYFDELTGIPSRRALREALLKLGNKYTIAMLDIDFFKKFNDRYGHDVGDEVLKMVATNLEDVTGGGKAFRYGGEEFTIIFPGKTISDVIPHLEELREQVSKSGYTQKPKKNSKSKRKNAKKLSVTISIGVSEKNSNHKTPNEVIKAADKALYRAKKKGRNCVSK